MTKKVIQVNKNPVYDFGMVSTVFGKDTEFNGQLNFSTSLQIDGIFDGEIESGGYLVIGEGAEVRANISAKTVILMGTVTGNVEATERLEIHSNGRLYGNIRTSKLKMADGVVFEGKCEMIKPAEKKTGSTAPQGEGQSRESA